MGDGARPSRRAFVGQLGALAGLALVGAHVPFPSPAVWRGRRAPQRAVVLMLDGLGVDYVNAAEKPALRGWMRDGLTRVVRGVMPSVTNANNASVCCGAWPAEHGISGNSYVDRRTGREEYMEDGALLRAPTLFERAAAAGVRSALLSCKKKTVPLLSRGAEIAMTAESPGAAWVERLGPAPPIYSREINYWLLRAAADVLARRPDVGCLYVHTTDYPMHTWAPDAAESREHLARVDALLGELAHAAPDAAFLVTADHGLGAKTRCWDLARALAARGLPVRIAISAERDRYLQHHKGYGGTGWVYLRAASDAGRAAELLHGLDGVEAVLTRDEAVRRFRLPPDRVGDLMVLGDAVTVFGELAEADGERETLPAGYRSHGSLREAAAVPLVIHNHDGPLGDAASYTHNLHLTRALFPTPRGA